MPKHGLVDGEGARDGHDGRTAAGRIFPPAALVATVAADVTLGHGGDGRRRRDDLVAAELNVIYARNESISLCLASYRTVRSRVYVMEGKYAIV